MKQIILHIGYPKTATTTLQQEVFRVLGRNGKINYFGMFCEGTGNEARKNAFFDDLRRGIYLDDYDFDAALPYLKDQLDGIYLPESINVLSNEHFTQSMWSGRWQGLWTSPYRTAQRLAQLFQGYEVKLIVGIRSQPALMRSFFVQQSVIAEHANATKLDANIDDYIDRCLSPDKFEGEMYHYDRVIRSFQEAFPDAACFLYNFDAFILDQKELIGSLISFLGLDNRSASDLEFPLGNRNRKNQKSSGTSIQNWSSLHHWLSRSAFGPFLKDIVRREGHLRQISDFFKREKIVPVLTAEQKIRIEANYEDPLTGSLAPPYPKVLPPLNEAGARSRD
nr:hypothetical protein [uncultured Celeribacter sp.]